MEQEILVEDEQLPLSDYICVFFTLRIQPHLGKSRGLRIIKTKQDKENLEDFMTNIHLVMYGKPVTASNSLCSYPDHQNCTARIKSLTRGKFFATTKDSVP
jgi:hypothetical protein